MASIQETIDNLTSLTNKLYATQNQNPNDLKDATKDFAVQTVEELQLEDFAGSAMVSKVFSRKGCSVSFLKTIFGRKWKFRAPCQVRSLGTVDSSSFFVFTFSTPSDQKWVLLYAKKDWRIDELNVPKETVPNVVDVGQPIVGDFSGHPCSSSATTKQQRSPLQTLGKNKDVSEFIIDELEDDTHEKMLKLVEKKFQRKKRYIQRGREEGHNRLVADYFSDQPVFPPYIFRRRFRMNKELFIRIVNSLSNHSDYFKLRKDATGKQGLSALQKCTAAIRQLAYGTPADQNDEYVRIGESTSIECLKNFCRGVIEVFGPTYLRRPNDEDVARVLHLHEEHHGFPGMLGSIDCMHWAWKNCPVAWHGQFTRGDHGVPTIMLEAVASQDLWIWHAFFGVAGSNNDINVLNQSTLFNDVLQGYSPDVTFTVNGTEYTKGYYLADGIYPEWATIVKSFSCPQDLKRKKFKEMQEAARKDVERAFGVLQSRWAIIRGAARFWMDTTMSDIIYACIIMHNMIVENEGNAISHWSDEDGDPPIRFRNGSVGAFNEYIQRSAEVRDKIVHNQLRSDLVEHIWEKN